MEGVLNMTRAEALATREEFLSFRLGQEEYAIDILQVREIRPHERVTRIAELPEFIRGVINLRGTIVPIVDLRVKFGLPAAHDASTVVIILHIAGRPVGIVVDAVSDVVAVLPEQVKPAPDVASVIRAGFIKGIATVEERLLIIVDIERLMSSHEMALLGEAA
jgi:purine-binding chemotaxis protein CheW